MNDDDDCFQQEMTSINTMSLLHILIKKKKKCIFLPPPTSLNNLCTTFLAYMDDLISFKVDVRCQVQVFAKIYK